MGNLQGQREYKVYDSDQNLTNEFVSLLCKAARNKTGYDQAGPTELEKLIIEAAGFEYQAEDQGKKSRAWHSKYGSQCYCTSSEDFEAGDILRQMVNSNFREFANVIGPQNRLSLDLSLKDPSDGMTILQYIDNKRAVLEEMHDNERSKFQKDSDWRNIMFFYFLFSEYSIN